MGRRAGWVVRFLMAAAVSGTTLLASGPASSASPESPPLLVVLVETGSERDGLPVFTPHPDSRRYLDVLGRGFSGRYLRLYRWVQTQQFRRDGTPVEPAYLVLTSHQGGFARYGFWLDGEPKRGVPYVDLHRNAALTGRFGAVDQIFPHELTHVLLRQLTGDEPAGGANQVHAVGVRTDPYVAFNEGLAECAQILAVDDTDASPETRALGSDPQIRRRAWRDLAAYERALSARWAPFARPRLTFPLWFSQTEQVLRYHAVKENLFAFEPRIPERLLRARDLYRAYLIANILPGDPSGSRRPWGRLLATEGAVSALFFRMVTSPDLQSRYRAREFYDAFGASPDSVSPVENVFLKLYRAFGQARPHDAAAAVRAYLDAFPDEAEPVERVLREVGFDIHREAPPAIWLANQRLMTGTSLFDQFRAMPRIHTFDLNAASRLDLLSVEGVDGGVADAILRDAPYGRVTDLAGVPGVTRELVQRFVEMEREMQRLRASATEDAASLSFRRILMPYLSRALASLVVTMVASGWLYRRVRPVPWSRAIANGASAATVGLAAAWSSDALGGAISWVLPAVVFGVPAATWGLVRHRSAAISVRLLAAWAFASVVPFVVTRSWF